MKLTSSQHLARFAVDSPSHEPKNFTNFVNERHFEMTRGRAFNSSLILLIGNIGILLFLFENIT